MENINNENKIALDPETIEWMNKKRLEDQAVAKRQETLASHMGNENFKYLYDNGLKSILDKDPSVLDNEAATKMAMQMTANQIQAAEKAKSEPEVKQETQPVSNGPEVQSAGSRDAATDPYTQPIKSMKDLDVSQFKNLSRVGRLNAELLKN